MHGIFEEDKVHSVTGIKCSNKVVAGAGEVVEELIR